MSEIKSPWVQSASEKMTIDDSKSVLVDRWGEVMHDPEKMDSSINMTKMSFKEAVKDNVSPCSSCYPNLHSFEKTEKILDFKNS